MYTQGWGVVPGEVATAVKFSQLGANDDYLKDAVDKAVAAGCIMVYPVPTPPIGWLICNGAAVSRTTYAALFAILGTSRGAGDGSTTFNLPDLKGRTVIGVDGSDTTIDTAGKQVGAKSVTLSLNEIPGHNHTGTTSANGQHNHGYSIVRNTQTTHYGDYARVAWEGYREEGRTTSDAGNHNHSFTTSTQGGGQAHTNMQPSDAEYWIIKY